MTDAEQRKIKISNHNWQKTVSIIMDYPYSKKELNESIEELVYSTSGDNDGQPKGNYKSSGGKTESIAIALHDTMYLERLRKETEAVESSYNQFGIEKQKVIKERYWMSRNSRPKPFTRICSNYSEMQMRRIAREMIIHVAIKLGYIRK